MDWRLLLEIWGRPRLPELPFYRHLKKMKIAKSFFGSLSDFRCSVHSAKMASDTVDGSESHSQPPGMVLKPCKKWDKLPTSTGELIPDFWLPSYKSPSATKWLQRHREICPRRCIHRELDAMWVRSITMFKGRCQLSAETWRHTDPIG